MGADVVGAPICARKRRYPRYSDAVYFRDELIRDPTLEVYWCAQHRAWHLWHDRTKGGAAL